MTERLNPPAVPQPAGPYAQGVVAAGPGRWLHVSGQIGVQADGTLAEGAGAQATVAWRNLVAVLAAAGMDTGDLVKVTTYLVDSADLPAVQAVRTGFLGEARPASTLVVVKELARKEWLFEVEAVAFRS